ncbi:MAG: hypothetical protein ACFFDC_15825 [Promethearchaeota archaeon]
MKFHSKILNDDLILEDDLHITGETTAHGSIQVFSLISEKTLTVSKDLETTKGPVIVKGSLKIGNDLVSSENITVEGTGEIKGVVRGKNIFITGKSVKAYTVEGKNVELWGDIKVEKDVSASESVEITIHPKKKSPRITGEVTAPIVTITFVGLFTKWFLLPATILKNLECNPE